MSQAELKAMTLRLDPVQWVRVQAVGRVLGLSVTDTVRAALDVYFDFVTSDEDFQQQLRVVLEDQRRVLASLIHKGGHAADG